MKMKLNIIGLVAILISACSECNNTVSEPNFSPDQTNAFFWVVESCGATSDTIFEGHLLSAESTSNLETISNKIGRNTKVMAFYRPESDIPNVQWIDNKTLKVSYKETSKLSSTRKDNVGDIQIIYITSD